MSSADNNRRKRWKCTTKPRGSCPAQCQNIFTGFGDTRREAKKEAEGACQKAGCHTPGATPHACECGHTTCYREPN